MRSAPMEPTPFNTRSAVVGSLAGCAADTRCGGHRSCRHALSRPQRSVVELRGTWITITPSD